MRDQARRGRTGLVEAGAEGAELGVPFGGSRDQDRRPGLRQVRLVEVRAERPEKIAVLFRSQLQGGQRGDFVVPLLDEEGAGARRRQQVPFEVQWRRAEAETQDAVGRHDDACRRLAREHLVASQRAHQRLGAGGIERLGGEEVGLRRWPQGQAQIGETVRPGVISVRRRQREGVAVVSAEWVSGDGNRDAESAAFFTRGGEDPS